MNYVDAVRKDTDSFMVNVTEPVGSLEAFYFRHPDDISNKDISNED
jgi:hypothetical protein